MKRLGSIGIVVMALGIAMSPAMASAQSCGPEAFNDDCPKSKKKTTATTQERSKDSGRGSAANRTWDSCDASTSRGRSTSHHRSMKGAESASAQSRHVHGHGATRVDHLPQPTAESRRLNIAFSASAQLRPMAQQLVTDRSPAAYAGVLAYAASHPGEAAASAELADRPRVHAGSPLCRCGKCVPAGKHPWCCAGRLRELPGGSGSGPGKPSPKCHPAIDSLFRSPSEQRVRSVLHPSFSRMPTWQGTMRMALSGFCSHSSGARQRIT